MLERLQKADEYGIFLVKSSAIKEETWNIASFDDLFHKYSRKGYMVTPTNVESMFNDIQQTILTKNIRQYLKGNNAPSTTSTTESRDQSMATEMPCPDADEMWSSRNWGLIPTSQATIVKAQILSKLNSLSKITEDFHSMCQRALHMQVVNNHVHLLSEIFHRMKC